jgi:hypothetical protein
MKTGIHSLPIKTIIANAFETGILTTSQERDLIYRIQNTLCTAADYELVDQLLEALIEGTVKEEDHPTTFAVA